MFAAFLTAILFSLSTVCGYRSAKQIGGTEANFWRITFATCILGAWAAGFGRGFTSPALSIFVLSGIIGIGLGDTAYFQTLPRLGPRLSLLLVQCLTAPFGALIEWLWLGTTLTPRQILCGATILTGVGIALMPGTHLKLTRRDWLTGAVAGILAALGGAGGAVLSRKGYAVVHANGEQLDYVTAGFQRVLGGLVIAAICLLIVKRQKLQRLPSHSLEPSKGKTRSVWIWILLNSLAGQTLGVTCLQWALETTPTGIVLSIVALSPIVVIPMAYFIEGERPTIHSLVGGMVAVAGVIALTLFR